MKLHHILFFVLSLSIVVACAKDEPLSERFKLLTSHIWLNDSLLANGVEASAPGELLDDFKGETKFNEDGTGNVGNIVGEWQFYKNETEIVITSDSLPVSVSVYIAELTANSLKVTTSYLVSYNPKILVDIRMTFVPK